jgi:Mn2+/Fe2+ NRAMP family transporter
MNRTKLQQFIQTLGPGILFASTAIGVSHLVQSTRAGAEYGFSLILFVVAANLFKYPFFEYGSRYANATNESLIDGYSKIGRPMLWLYFLITIGSMFFVSAAVGAVTSGFLQNLFGLGDWGMWTTAGLFAFCLILLLVGSYKALDSLIKIIGLVLLISTVLAFSLALIQGPSHEITSVPFNDLLSGKSLLFIIALMGWMPTAVDLSTWISLWTEERIRQTGYKPTLKQSIAEFNLGYFISAALALFFVVLGAYMLNGSGKELPDGAGAFAHEVVGLFTGFIGDWSYLIIAASAFSIMFGTCIAVFDGYGRSLERSLELLFVKEKSNHRTMLYRISLIVVICGAFFIIFFFGKHMTQLVDLATTISFLIAPIIAFVNFRLVTGKHIPAEAKPGKFMRSLSWAGIIFLTGFALVYGMYS